MALDEATTALLTQLAEMGSQPLHELEPAEARVLINSLSELSGPGPEMDRVQDHELEGVEGSFRIRVLVPRKEVGAAIVFYHGGGWVIGDIDGYDTLGRVLAERTGAAVVLVDYRLAPEHRYPTAADDSWVALQWVAEHLRETGRGPIPLIVAGDSAGGNLAAIMAQKAHAAGAPELALQVLIYPVTDDDLDNATYSDPQNQLLLTRDSMVWFWNHYAPDVASRANVDASPIKAADLSGLPPAVVVTAEHDVLRQEGEAYADRLAEAGVSVTRRRFDGQMHGFFTMVNVLPGSAAAIDYVVAEIERHLARTAASQGQA